MYPSALEPFLAKVEKPARYTGGEYGQLCKDWDACDVNVCFCFPDTYEIGMSNLGMMLLCGAMNQQQGTWCQRCFAPWPDMAEVLRKQGIPLYALESGRPLGDFDLLAFTLQYELCYTNVLYMLELAGIPLLAEERGEEFPIILGGGPCAVNPEPVAAFFDLFSIGEGEEALPELMELYRRMKGQGKAAFLREAAKLKGFYVPSLYRETYHEDGTLASFAPVEEGVPEKVQKRIVQDLDKAFVPVQTPVPYAEAVHDRVALELFRGCTRGCRFCQACQYYRPMRYRSPEVLLKQAKAQLEATGYNEMSLISLSTSDYPCLKELADALMPWCKERNISLSLPSLRVDNFSEELLKQTQTVRQTGLTFAPEAGTQRLRDVINKNVTEEQLMQACALAFAGGRTNVKLYYMMGLPTETDEDICGIARLSQNVVGQFYHTENRPKTGRGVNVSISVAVFIPKPFTPFQWAAQDELEAVAAKQKLLAQSITTRKITYSYHDAKVSRVEAAFARGDRRMAKVLLAAYRNGAVFDSWDEFFSYERYEQAFAEAGLDMGFYANRARGEDELLPWDFIDLGVSRRFLRCEYERALKGQTTQACMDGCVGCGADKLLEGGRTCRP